MAETKNKNRDFIFKSLEVLEKHGKIKEIHWLAESYFCEVTFGISWKDEVGASYPVLKPLFPQIDKTEAKKSIKGKCKDIYFKDEIILDGIPFLVYNNWLDNVRTAFLNWLKTVLGSDFPELPEIEANLI